MRAALWPDSDADEIDAVLRLPTSEGIVLVGERDEGGLRGFAEIGLRKYADGCNTSPVAYLEGIWIDPDCRRSRVASDLFREAEAWARSLGLTEFASDCDIENHVSEAFHLATGFEEVERHICWRRDLSPESP